MNLILFERDEIGRPLARHDQRAHHIIEVLRCKIGDWIRVGIINGGQGLGQITAIEAHSLSIRIKDTLAIEHTAADNGAIAQELLAIDMLIGLPRPPVIRRLLRDLTSIGVGQIILYGAQRSEKSYYDSRYLQPPAIRAALLEGASQGGVTLLPRVSICRHIEKFLGERRVKLGSSDNKVLLLTTYEALIGKCTPVNFISYLMAHQLPPQGRLLIAVGPERGWELSELQQFKASFFCPVELGGRTLRSENVATAAALLAAQYHNMQHRNP